MTDPTVNTPPANTVFITGANVAYPAAPAPATPVITEIYSAYPLPFGTAPLGGTSW